MNIKTVDWAKDKWIEFDPKINCEYITIVLLLVTNYWMINISIVLLESNNCLKEIIKNNNYNRVIDTISVDKCY